MPLSSKFEIVGKLPWNPLEHSQQSDSLYCVVSINHKHEFDVMPVRNSKEKIILDSIVLIIRDVVVNVHCQYFKSSWRLDMIRNVFFNINYFLGKVDNFLSVSCQFKAENENIS